MLFTRKFARVSTAAFLAAVAIVVILWDKSIPHLQYIQYQGKDYYWRLSQSEGFLKYFVVPGVGRDRSGLQNPGFHYAEEDSMLMPLEDNWRSKPVFEVDLGKPYGDWFCIGFPHWYLLCFSLVLLLPAVVHWRMKRKLAEQAAAMERDRPRDGIDA